MAVRSSDTPDLTRKRRKLENELQASLVFLVGGVLLLAVWGMFSVSTTLPTGPGNVFWFVCVGIGSTLTLVGAVCTVINWALLRRLPAVALT